jgi:hypothetical protein
MKTFSRCLAAIAIGIACLTPLTAFAQSEKITLKMIPEPNQTIRMKMVQEMEIEMSFEGDQSTGNFPAGPMKMAAKTVFGMTQKVGPQDKQGNIVSEVTYDELSSEMTMNGQSMQVGDEVGKFIGKKATATFDKQGDLVDIKIPSDLGVPEETFKQLMKSLYGNLPKTPISVGETAATPLDFALPVPVPGAGPLKMDGQIKFKLVSIERGVEGRQAKFDQSLDGKMASVMEVPTPNGAVKMSLDFTMNGVGVMLMNVDKGWIKSSDLKSTFSGKIKPAGEAGEPAPPTMKLQGSMKMMITGSN